VRIIVNFLQIHTRINTRKIGENMTKLTDRICTNTKPKSTGDLVLSDAYGLYLRIRIGGTKVWIVDYVIPEKRRKISIGDFDINGGNAQTLDELLDGGILYLSQARMVASERKRSRRNGIDPVKEREKKQSDAAILATVASNQPTIEQVIEKFLVRHIDGKKSAAAVKYRLHRLSLHIGSLKIRGTKKAFRKLQVWY
jgi:Arm DNA-binding domain